MNISIVQLVLAVGAGLALGIFYFGGLWLTVKRTVASKHPHAWAILSFLARTAVFAGVIYLFVRIEPDGPVLAMVCFLAFFVVRIIILRKIGPVLPRHVGAPTDDERKA